MSIALTINGEERRFDEVADLADLVTRLGLDPRKVAVERNLEIVPRSTYAATPIAHGDRIEIVHFIGGG
jgi:sulfur carrier protein